MARLARLYAPNTPQLVLVRLARPLASAHEATPARTLSLIEECLITELQRRPVALHGWVVLVDRVVLLATPAQADALPRVIQGLGRNIASRVIHGRAFHERYRSALVGDGWIISCLLWLETLPLRHSLVDHPARWPWSSAAEHLGTRADTGLLTDHTAYWSLGNTPFARQARYQELLHTGLTPHAAAQIHRTLQGQWALGEAEFTQHIATRSSRRAVPASRGRPRKLPL